MHSKLQLFINSNISVSKDEFCAFYDKGSLKLKPNPFIPLKVLIFSYSATPTTSAAAAALSDKRRRYEEPGREEGGAGLAAAAASQPQSLFLLSDMEMKRATKGKWEGRRNKERDLPLLRGIDQSIPEGLTRSLPAV